MRRRQIKVFLRKPFRDKIILNNAKKGNQIIYGQRSIQKHTGTVSRPTEDYDVLAKNPKKAAMKTERDLDKLYGFDYTYTKPAQHSGTWKVKGRGFDMKEETADDESIADYTEITKPAPKFSVFRGIRYRKLQQEIKAKKKSLADSAYKFRHSKDRRDLELVQSVLRVAKIARPKFPKFSKL